MFELLKINLKRNDLKLPLLLIICLQLTGTYGQFDLGPQDEIGPHSSSSPDLLLDSLHKEDPSHFAIDLTSPPAEEKPTNESIPIKNEESNREPKFNDGDEPLPDDPTEPISKRVLTVHPSDGFGLVEARSPQLINTLGWRPIIPSVLESRFIASKNRFSSFKPAVTSRLRPSPVEEFSVTKEPISQYYFDLASSPAVPQGPLFDPAQFINGRPFIPTTSFPSKKMSLDSSFAQEPSRVDDSVVLSTPVLSSVGSYGVSAVVVTVTPSDVTKNTFATDLVGISTEHTQEISELLDENSKKEEFDKSNHKGIENQTPKTTTPQADYDIELDTTNFPPDLPEYTLGNGDDFIFPTSPPFLDNPVSSQNEGNKGITEEETSDKTGDDLTLTKLSETLLEFEMHDINKSTDVVHTLLAQTISPSLVSLASIPTSTTRKALWMLLSQSERPSQSFSKRVSPTVRFSPESSVLVLPSKSILKLDIQTDIPVLASSIVDSTPVLSVDTNDFSSELILENTIDETIVSSTVLQTFTEISFSSRNFDIERVPVSSSISTTTDGTPPEINSTPVLNLNKITNNEVLPDSKEISDLEFPITKINPKHDIHINKSKWLSMAEHTQTIPESLNEIPTLDSSVLTPTFETPISTPVAPLVFEGFTPVDVGSPVQNARIPTTSTLSSDDTISPEDTLSEYISELNIVGSFFSTEVFPTPVITTDLSTPTTSITLSDIPLEDEEHILVTPIQEIVSATPSQVIESPHPSATINNVHTTFVTPMPKTTENILPNNPSTTEDMDYITTEEFFDVPVETEVPAENEEPKSPSTSTTTEKEQSTTTSTTPEQTNLTETTTTSTTTTTTEPTTTELTTSTTTTTTTEATTTTTETTSTTTSTLPPTTTTEEPTTTSSTTEAPTTTSEQTSVKPEPTEPTTSTSTDGSSVNITDTSKEVPYVKAVVDYSEEEFCLHKDNFKHLMAQWISKHLNISRTLDADSIAFFKEPNCTIHSDMESLDDSFLSPDGEKEGLTQPEEVENEQGTSVYFYVKDEGKMSPDLTEKFPLFPKELDISEDVHYLKSKIWTLELVQPDTRVSDFEGEDSGALDASLIAIVVVSTLVALTLIIGFIVWFMIRRKQADNNYYGRRCRPVSMDAYSMDSVSVYHSVRHKNKRRASNRSIKSYLNQAFDDPNGPSRPLNFAKLTHFISDIDGVYEEFGIIPVNNPKYDELPRGAEDKNRYANVVPVPETRVPLKLQKEIRNSDYINANYVRGPRNESKYYIATQAPLDDTVCDFWRMIWEQESKVILMLTDYVERGIDKCADYLPPSETLDCHRVYGDFQVTLKSRDIKDKFMVSHVQLKNLENNLVREIAHAWYTGWPAAGVPNEEKSFISYILDVRRTRKTLRAKGPIVVHCSPGTGRTGTWIGCDLGMRQFDEGRMVDIPKIVYNIRRDRAGAVQTKEQYAFIYRVVNLYASKLTTGNLDSL